MVSDEYTFERLTPRGWRITHRPTGTAVEVKESKQNALRACQRIVAEQSDALTDREILRRDMLQNGLSQRALARRAKVGHDAISNYLAGKRQLRPAMIQRLFAALGEGEQ